MCDHDTAAEEKKKAFSHCYHFFILFVLLANSSQRSLRRGKSRLRRLLLDMIISFFFPQSALCSLCSFVLEKKGKDEQGFP